MVLSEFSDVFISYRRANLSKTEEGIIRRLVRELRELGKEVWVDWEDIPPASTSFSADIEAGLNGCEAFLCVLSPDYMDSTYCVDLELGTAIKNNKKIIPIMVEDLGDKWSKLPKEVGNINVIFMYPKDGHPNTFEEGFLKIQTALEADYEYRKRHTRLFLSTQEWDENGRPDYMLLSGDEAISTRRRMKEYSEKTPAILELQEEFITTSYEKQKAKKQTEKDTQKRISDLAHYSIIQIVAQAKAAFNEGHDYDALRVVVEAFNYIDDSIYLEYASVLLIELVKRYSYPHNQLVLKPLSDRDNPDHAPVFRYHEKFDPKRFKVKLERNVFEVVDTLDNDLIINRYEWTKELQTERDWEEYYYYEITDDTTSKRYVQVTQKINIRGSEKTTSRIFDLVFFEFYHPQDKYNKLTVHPVLGTETSNANRSVEWETVHYEYDDAIWGNTTPQLAGTKFGTRVQIFNPKREARLHTEFYVQGSWITGADWHSNERYLMLCTVDSKVYIYDYYRALIFVLDLPQALHIAWHENKPELLIRDKDDKLFSIDIEAEGQDYRTEIGDYLPHHSVSENGLKTLSKNEIIACLDARGIPVEVIGKVVERRVFELAEGYLFNDQSQLLVWIRRQTIFDYKQDFFRDDWDYRSRWMRLNGGHKYRLIDLNKQEMVEFIGIHYSHIHDFISPYQILVDGCILPLKMSELVDHAKSLIQSEVARAGDLPHLLP